MLRKIIRNLEKGKLVPELMPELIKEQNLMLIKFGEVKRDLQQKKINSHTVLSDCFDVQDYDFGERLSFFRRFFYQK